jgi:hypothetical protein
VLYNGIPENLLWQSRRTFRVLDVKNHNMPALNPSDPLQGVAKKSSEGIEAG